MATIYYVAWYDEDYDNRRGGYRPVNGDGSLSFSMEVPTVFYGRQRLAQEAADRFNARPEEVDWQKRRQEVWPDSWIKVRYEVQETELQP